MNQAGATHFEENLRRDADRIRAAVQHMGRLCEDAVRRSFRALRGRDRQTAFSVILRDQRIDEMEIEIDRLCLEFLVRQQPAAGPLRLAYSTIRINLELERIGDYAESIARQVLKLIGEEAEFPVERYEEIAEISAAMLRDAIDAYTREDGDLARRTMRAEDAVDELKSRINRDLVRMFRDQRLPFEVLNALMMIARRFERISDQARNICLEVVYMCTGEPVRHPGSRVFRVLFIDAGTSCRSLMAVVIGRALSASAFEFDAASVDPTPMDPAAARFLERRGLPAGSVLPQALGQIGDLHGYSVIVALDSAARAALPRDLRKVVVMDWSMPDPMAARETDEEEAAFDAAAAFLRQHIDDLVNAVMGEEPS